MDFESVEEVDKYVEMVGTSQKSQERWCRNRVGEISSLLSLTTLSRGFVDGSLIESF